MAKGNRKVPEINSSSTADIAFLLLIFFLITTSMDTDRGLARRLPEPPQENQPENPDKVKERNVLQIFLNSSGEVLCNNEVIDVSTLKDRAKDFIANPYDDPTKPERVAKDVPLLGTMQVTEKHVISLQCNRGSAYKSYIAVQDELVAAYNELRNELAQDTWGKDYAALDAEQQKAVRDVYPQKISEAEPRKYGEK
ncbi:MAG: biopolymer transporter ExbD [Prevotellaceae bacterium]|jgi:biopolymer transport protein ExbD|nr:biopolymer transporter ExbD [Prevotellaceae bacterium]